MSNTKAQAARRAVIAHTLSTLKEHHAYWANVACHGSNPPFRAILFVGFHNGSYCEVYTNNMSEPIGATSLYSLEVTGEIGPLKLAKRGLADEEQPDPKHPSSSVDSAYDHR